MAGWVSWGIVPLVWASPWVQSWYQGLVSEHRDLEALEVTESQQDVSEQAPGAAPGCVRPPPYHRQALPHPPTALPPLHPGSTCRQHAWHPCCTARLRSRSLRALAPVASLLGTSGNPLPGCSKGEWGVGRFGVW